MDASEIDKKIEALGVGLFHKRTVIILALGNAADAVEVLSIGYILAVYEEQNEKLSRLHQSLLTAAVFIGMLIGGIIFGRLGDFIGRRSSLLVSLSLNGFAALLAAMSWSIGSLIFMRVLAGVGVGGSVPSIFTLCTEHFPIKQRGFFTSIVASFWMVGSIFTAALAWCTLKNQEDASWRAFSVFTSFPAFSCLILTWLYVPESARFFAMQGRFDDAEHILNYIRCTNGTESTPLIYGTKSALLEKQSTPIMKKVAPPIWSLIENVGLRSIAMPLFCSWFCLSFGSYGLATWITLIFKRIGLLDPFGNAFLYALANLPGNITSTFLVDKLGRKWLLVLSMGMASISAVLFGYVADSASKAWIVLFACLFNAFSISGWNALDILSSESFSTDIRATALGFLSAGGRTGSIVAQFVNGYLVGPPMHVTLLLWTTSALMMVGGLITILLKDTTGRALTNSMDDLPGNVLRASRLPVSVVSKDMDRL